MSDTNKKEDEKFNETVKRMLETPPKQHDDEKSKKVPPKKEKFVA